MRRPSLSTNRRLVDLWNLCVDTGSDVTFRPAIGRPVTTRTASRAHMVGSEPFVIVMAPPGRVPLDRVMPASIGG